MVELGISRLGIALLARSRSELESILQAEPRSTSERFFSHNTAFHLASGWPEGLKMLLEGTDGFDSRNSRGESPLCMEIRGRNARSTRLLLNAGCELTDIRENYFLHSYLDIVGWTGTDVYDKDERLEDEWPEDEGSDNPGHGIGLAILDALKPRREELRALALYFLNEQEQADYGLLSSHLPDARAAELVRDLSIRGVKVPSSIGTHLASSDGCAPVLGQSTVYHATLAAVSKLWNAGFRDVGVYSRKKGFPLDCLMDDLARTQFWSRNSSYDYAMRQLRIANWFLSRDALLCEEPHQACGSTLRGLTAKLGSLLALSIRIRDGDDDDDALNELAVKRLTGETLHPLFATMFVPQHRDSCECHCSPRGCSGVSKCLKAYSFLGQVKHPKWLPLEVLAFQLAQERELWASLIPDIIRAETFKLMGLPHTCCKLKDKRFSALHSDDEIDNGHPDINFEPPMPQSLIHEIHDDYSEAILRFEKLLPELIDTFWKSGLDLIKYLDGPYKCRMDEVIVEESLPLPPDEIAAITELGVVLGSDELDSDHEE